MPLSQTAVPNIPDTTQLLNDSYTDRSSETHTGIVAEDNRLRDIMASIQANASTIITSMEGSISSNSGAIRGLQSTVSTLNLKVSENTEDINTNASSILALTQTLEADIANVRSLIAQNASRISDNKGSIDAINSSLTSLTSLVSTMNSAFYNAMQSSNLRVVGEYQYLDELPSFAGAASQGSFALVGHTPPQVGDVIYQAASSSWVKVQDWNLVAIAASFALVPTPTSITDIVAIGSNGNYILHQPVMSYGDDGITPKYAYDETVSLGSPAAIVASTTALPKITLSDGSMVAFQYHYRTLVSNASEGETALVGSDSYVYKNGAWVKQSPSHKFFVMAWNGAWIPLSTGAGAGGGGSLTMTKLSSNSTPTFSGTKVGDVAYYRDGSITSMNSMWEWDGIQWVRVSDTSLFLQKTDTSVVKVNTSPSLAGASFTSLPTSGSFHLSSYNEFSTLNALNGTTGQYVGQEARVTANPTSTLNGVYYWTGSSWNRRKPFILSGKTTGGTDLNGLAKIAFPAAFPGEKPTAVIVSQGPVIENASENGKIFHSVLWSVDSDSQFTIRFWRSDSSQWQSDAQAFIVSWMVIWQ